MPMSLLAQVAHQCVCVSFPLFDPELFPMFIHRLAHNRQMARNHRPRCPKPRVLDWYVCVSTLLRGVLTIKCGVLPMGKPCR